MHLNSITFKSLLIITVSLITLAVCVITVSDFQLRKIIDDSQTEIYQEKIDRITGMLDRRYHRLQETMRMDAYEKEFQNSFLTAFRKDYYQHTQEFYPFIFDYTGKCVAHPFFEQGDTTLANLDFNKKMIRVKNGSFDYSLGGQRNWMVFKQFRPWHWIIGYSVPLEQKYADAFVFRNILIFIITVITASVLTALLIIVTRFTSSISRLTRASSEIAAGNLDHSIDTGRKDELGVLAQSFSYMRNSIKEKINILGQKNESLKIEISERGRVETKLRESEELYRSLVENIDLGVTLINSDHIIVMANAAMGKMFGKPASLFQGRKCFKEFEKRDTICSHCPGVKAMASGKPAEAITHGVRDDGSSLTVRIKAFPVRGEQNMHKGFIEVVEDITEHLEAEKTLAAERERLAVTLRSIGDGVITTDTSGKIILINKIAEDLTGWNQGDAVGRPLEEVFHIIHEGSRKLCENPFKKVLDSGRILNLSDRIVLVAKDGTERSIADSGAPIRDKSSQIIGVVIVFRDVTAKLRLEKELLKVKKIESVGVLAGGIAHDFNNILVAILGNLSMATQFINSGDKVYPLLIDAQKASLRAKDLTQQLLTFSKGGEPVKETASIPEVIKDSANFILHGGNVACQYHIPDDLWLVKIDKGQMSQVIQNIIINSNHAMPEGGVIHISCENTNTITDKGIILPRTDNYIKITINDSGIGIPENIIDKIFDPYFTTKQEGSGLGLAITHSIIRKHSGHISVRSKSGKGTTFTIYLPAIVNEIQKEKITGTALIKGKGKILVMDDEEIVRDVSKNMLEYLGYEVLLAKDGTEAVGLYKELIDSPEPVVAVVMDLTVPGGMGGKEAVKKILAIDPDAKVIVSSGYSNDPIMARYNEYGFNASIVKPFQLQELTKVINQVLS